MISVLLISENNANESSDEKNDDKKGIKDDVIEKQVRQNFFVFIFGNYVKLIKYFLIIFLANVHKKDE